MAVFASETDQGVANSWLYNPDLFEISTVVRMAGLYQTVLEKVAANPEITLDLLKESLAEAERQQRASEQKDFQEASLRKLKTLRRKATTEA